MLVLFQFTEMMLRSWLIGRSSIGHEDVSSCGPELYREVV